MGLEGKQEKWETAHFVLHETFYFDSVELIFIEKSQFGQADNNLWSPFLTIIC
jgi:hypothetical protein